MGMKKIVFGLVFVLVILATLMSALAYSPEDTLNEGDLLNITVTEVKLNGDVIENGDTIKTLVERGEEIEIKVELISYSDENNVEVRAMITGDDHHKLEEVSEVFDIGANERRIVTLKLKLPNNMDKDEYSLRVMVTDRIGQVKIYNYHLKLTTSKHEIEIRDVILSPMYKAMSGKSLFATLRLKNSGLKDEESVKVTVTVPELDLGASTIVDKIESEDQVTTEEMWLGRIPRCVKEGEYDLLVKVEFNEGDDIVQEKRTIRIYDSGLCVEDDKTEEKELIINVLATQKDLTAKEGVVYPIVLTNPGKDDLTVTVSVSGIEGWAIGKIEPSPVVIVPAKESVTVSLYVSANEDASEGTRPITLTFKSEAGSEQAVLSANVVKVSNNGMKTGLQIALIVLVVLLFVLGLIIGLTKSKREEKEEEEEYY